MKYAVILSNLGSCSDRYVTGGYSPAVGLEELFARLDSMEGVSGVELVGTWHVTKENMDFLVKETQKRRLPVVSIIPDHFGTADWKKGAFTSPDAATRQKAVEEGLFMCECARRLGCSTISIWNGQDGYDYPMQVDYTRTNDWLVEGIRQVAEQAPDINISLEYKPKEPRNHCFLPNVYSALYTAEKTQRDNVGVTVDFGHALEAYENVSEAVCLAIKNKKLMHIHINDNFRVWDDDMITGSVHTIEYIELFYWLKKLGYDGYLSIDQYPYRENARDAAQESIHWMEALERAAERIDEQKMAQILAGHDAVASTRYLRELLFDR